MHPVFNHEAIGLDWPVLFIGHLIMFWSLASRLDWSWIPLTDHERLCGSDGDQYRTRVLTLNKIYENS